MLTWLLGLPSSSSPRAVRRPHRRDHRRRRHATAIDFSVVHVEGHPAGDPRARSRPASSPSPRRSSPTRSRGATTASPTAATASATAQIFTSSLVALAHGTNDAQKTMGVITLTLDHRRAASRVGSRPADLGHRRLRDHDRARHLHGRLAHHPDARQGAHRRQARAGLRSRDVDRRDDPRLERTSASRCRRPRSPRARSSARVSADAGRRCAGARPAASWSAGSSRCPPPAPSARSRRSSSRGSAAGASSSTPSSPSWSSSASSCWSRRNAVTAANAMSEVADSGRAVKVKRNPKPKQKVKS